MAAPMKHTKAKAIFFISFPASGDHNVATASPIG